MEVRPNLSPLQTSKITSKNYRAKDKFIQAKYNIIKAKNERRNEDVQIEADSQGFSNKILTSKFEKELDTQSPNSPQKNSNFLDYLERNATMSYETGSFDIYNPKSSKGTLSENSLQFDDFKENIRNNFSEDLLPVDKIPEFEDNFFKNSDIFGKEGVQDFNDDMDIDEILKSGLQNSQNDQEDSNFFLQEFKDLLEEADEIVHTQQVQEKVKKAEKVEKVQKIQKQTKPQKQAKSEKVNIINQQISNRKQSLENVSSSIGQLIKKLELSNNREKPKRYKSRSSKNSKKSKITLNKNKYGITTREQKFGDLQFYDSVKESKNNKKILFNRQERQQKRVLSNDRSSKAKHKQIKVKRNNFINKIQKEKEKNTYRRLQEKNKGFKTKVNKKIDYIKGLVKKYNKNEALGYTSNSSKSQTGKYLKNKQKKNPIKKQTGQVRKNYERSKRQRKSKSKHDSKKENTFTKKQYYLKPKNQKTFTFYNEYKKKKSNTPNLMLPQNKFSQKQLQKSSHTKSQAIMTTYTNLNIEKKPKTQDIIKKSIQSLKKSSTQTQLLPKKKSRNLSNKRGSKPYFTKFKKNPQSNKGKQNSQRKQLTSRERNQNKKSKFNRRKRELSNKGYTSRYSEYLYKKKTKSRPPSTKVKTVRASHNFSDRYDELKQKFSKNLYNQDSLKILSKADQPQTKSRTKEFYISLGLNFDDRK